MVLQDLDYIFTTLDIECNGYIEWIELHEFDETIYDDALDFDHLEAAIETVCGPNSNGRCYREYFSDIAKELERRHVMEERIKWDFRALDIKGVGRLPLETTLFLFKATHNDRFSNSYWEKFLAERRNPDSDVCLDEVKLYLCNIPDYDVTNNSDEDYEECERILKDSADIKKYEEFKQLQGLQETEEYLASLEKERIIHSNKIKNNANNLLNRMDEMGLRALLEDDFGDGQTYEGRPKDKVTATELLDALRDKYNVLRDELLLQMLRNHTGEGMWQVLSENERQEKLFQLKIKEEKLRKEGKLETMAIDLPGSRISVKYNVFSLMGESVPELEQRIIDQQEKVRESGLPIEEVVREFGKKLNDKENLNSSASILLLNLNNRYVFERDTLTKKLQGKGGFSTLTASDREKIMFSFVQAILRGMQEKSFMSCALCVGLSERVKPRNHERSAKDPEKNLNLSLHRLQSFKDRRSLDGPVLPPKLYKLKSKLGRLDLILQILQECEHRFSLEREILLSMMNSKQVLQHRVSVRKLAKPECEKQLSVLYAQWLGWRNKSLSEKITLRSQVKSWLEEAVALKFELVKDEVRDEGTLVISDDDACTSLLSTLQMRQDCRCETYLNIGAMDKTCLEELWHEQRTAIEEEWNDNIAVVLFGIVEVSKEESELLDALQNKYDVLKDKLLMQALMDDYGKAEWDKLSEKDRQRRLMELKLQEKKLRKEGKYDEIAKLLGDMALSSDVLNKQLGDNRENYMNQLNERLRNRQRRIDAGEDPDTIEDDFLEEPPSRTTGNILKDLDQRFEDEKDALIKRLREGDDQQSKERERQAELMRLRLEARKAGREANFDSAALVLGLAERNKAALEDRLQNDRERQEKLAKERLEARRQRKNQVVEEILDKVEPQKDDIVGWRDLALKELALTQEKEYNLFSDMLQDSESEDLRQEAREQTPDDRQQRLNELREKRDNLDFEVLTGQEQHMSIMEMAIAIKSVIWDEQLKSTLDEVDPDKTTISSLANIQEIHDAETRKTMDLLPNMSQEELAKFRDIQIQARNENHLNNVAQLVFKYEGCANDEEFVNALDKKYDTLLDKLALEALEKQMGEAEWKRLSEKERQAQAMKLKLKQKQLMREGKLDEAAKLLGEGFQCDANLKKLMGDSRKNYDKLLQERLEKRRNRIANGEDVSDMEDESLLPEDQDLEDELVERTSAKSLLENLQARYEDEKEELLARLHGADKSFMNEKERQAELIRLKREQRKAQKEGRFDTAAMMLGLAERNKATADSKLANDRARQEMIAKERLEKLRSKRVSKDNGEENLREDDILETEEIKNESDIHNAFLKLIEKRQMLEHEELVEYLQTIDESICENASVMNQDGWNSQLSTLKTAVMETDDFRYLVSEMAAYKMVSRIEALQSINKEKTVSNDDAIISLIADLQENQNKEDENILEILKSGSPDDISEHQKQELEYISSKKFPLLLNVLSSPDETKSADSDTLVSALNIKYDALKDKLILEALEKQMGDAAWTNMTEKERQQELVKIKLEQRRLNQQGKVDDASRILNELLKNDTNVQSLFGLSKAEQEERLKERLEKRKRLKNSGMTDEEIAAVETKEDEELEVEIAKSSTGNALLDLEKNYEAEKDALLNSLKNADSKLAQEKRRQLELARLRREAKKVQAEEKFGTAAMVLGMAKSQQAALEVKMKSDRSRQEKLAKERLEARRNKRLSKQQKIDEPIEEAEGDDAVTLHGNILNVVEKIHDLERNVLLELTQEDGTGFHEKATSLSSEDRKKRLFVLKELRKNWRETLEDSGEQTDIYREAMYLKTEEVKHSSESNMEDEDVFVQLLADLQDSQDLEAESLMKGLTEKDTDTLKQLLQIKKEAFAKKCYDNIALVLLDFRDSLLNTEENSAEDELSDALKEKYDALKEKVYEAALKEKYGKDTWDAMTTKEKEELIANMKANDQLHTNEEESTNNFEDIMLPSIDDTNTKNVKAIDILKDLETQFEAEKEALLSSLRDADTRDMNERERQLKLALLRRDKKRIKREENYDGAALLFNMAKQNESEKEKNYKNERTRQEQLAKERIAARRKKKTETDNESDKMKEEEEDNMKQDLMTVEKMEREGSIALHESALREMEEKHYAEQDKLYELIQLTVPDKLIQVCKIAQDEQNAKLSLVSISRNKLKEQCRAFLDSEVVEGKSEEEKRNFEKTLSKGRSSQSQVIHDGLVISLVIKSNNMGKPVTEGQLDEDVTISMMADLQELQSLEANALVCALNDCDKNGVVSLKQELRKSRSAGYLDNLATIVFRECNKKIDKEVELADIEELKEEEKKIEAEVNEQLDELEKELEKKRKELPTMSGDEMQEYMDELKRQEDARRQTINDQYARQRDLAKQKLLAKQKKRDDKLQESAFANTLIADAHKSAKMIREKTVAMQGAQKDILAERLQRRRDEKKRKQLEAEENEVAGDFGEKIEVEADTDKKSEVKTEDSPISIPEPVVKKVDEMKQAEVKKKKIMPPLPGGGLKREKTVVEKAAELPETKKQEMINILMREQTSLAMKISSEQSRQEEQVRNLREKRRKKMQARETEAAAVLGLGQRQKTMVEERQKGERERQIGQIRDRVNRIKQERNSARSSREEDTIDESTEDGNTEPGTDGNTTTENQQY